MKKNFVYAMMSAIALTGAVCFSSCSSSDELADVNPTFDGEKVKTAFTISVGDVKSPVTRMEADPVQQDEAFNGMTDIYLFPFTTTIASSTTINESYIHLDDIAVFDTKVAGANGKIYNDVSFSVGVNNFLFYGVSKIAGNGKLKPSYLGMEDDTNWSTEYAEWTPTPINKGASKVGDYTNNNGITFDLVPIKRGWSLTGAAAVAATETTPAVPAISAVKGTEPAEKTIAPLKAVDTELASSISKATEDNNGQSHDGVIEELEKLQKTLRNVISDPGETVEYGFYAGSSPSIKYLMTMLYNTLKDKAATYTIGTTNYTSNIISKIEEFFEATSTSEGTVPYTLNWVGDPGFPANIGLPDGAAAVQFVNGAFDYVTPVMSGLTALAIDNYTYPASLYYTVNTNARVKDQEYLNLTGHESSPWSDIVAEYTSGAVTASTRSVIMEKQVQYGVGRLDVYVNVKPATIINDNSKGGEQPVTVPTGGYKLTGVLIGGQRQVGWDFKPISNESKEMTIWDKIMTGSAANSDVSPIFAQQSQLSNVYSGPNHTLALETAAGSPINIALEFENTGNDFCGINHNLIPAGSKFYLVAQLNPASNNDGHVEQDPETSWDDTQTTITQVIKQDYITTANLTIGANSLKSAYNVVPDLRSPKLEFGLSVDLHWRTGLTFTQEF